jgi:hypothetical protein
MMDKPPKRVIVYYPRGSRTGGPEALHQLVSTLRDLDVEAYLTPFEGTHGYAPVLEYAHYRSPEIERVIDAADVAVIVPEVYPEGLVGLKKAQKFYWWLSIDNAPAFNWRNRRRRWTSPKAVSRLRSFVALRELMEIHKGGLHHLVQSHYAWSFLNSQLEIVSSLVSDYTVDLKAPAPDRESRDPAVVAYNPAKGGELALQLRQWFGSRVTWLPLANMSRTEVASALRATDIYLDLGHHPGKDRLPREAALAGALTLVARRGAGAYAADVPIPLCHKICFDGDVVANAAAAIERVLPRLDSEVRNQDFYRRVIRAEKAAFERQVKNVFCRGVLGLDLDIPGVSLPDTGEQ